MNELTGIVIDGVTGAGKSSVVCELRKSWSATHTIVDEERTLGEFMSEELRDDRVPPAAKIWRLESVLEDVRKSPSGRYVLERFHPSYYALLPNWGLYEAIDAELANRGYGLVMLTIPEPIVSARTLFRVDRARTSWTQDMIAHFQSERAALDAIRDSQQRRLELLRITSLPTLVVDTSRMDWAEYAKQIIGFCTSP